ncbi:MAG: glycoside hydrolase family 97 catalytic domain-containing protein [Planctomycetes bacterium]|nr:glycoside hydrolase family 97 catalytic domain-containing protein [Planctomycetota bacterium]
MKTKHFLFSLTGLTLLLATTVWGAAVQSLASPNGQLQINLTLDKQKLFYSITENGRKIIKKSPLGMSFDGVPAAEGMKNFSYEHRKHVSRNVITQNNTRNAIIPEEFNMVELGLRSGVSIQLRAYNDGLALRWKTDFAKDCVIVDKENLSLGFTENFKAYSSDASKKDKDFYSFHEYVYSARNMEDFCKRPVAAPFLTDLNNGQFLLITDINVESYPGMWFHRGEKAPLIEAAFPKFPLKTRVINPRSHHIDESADYIAKTFGKRHYPWRVFMINDAKGLLETELSYLLADPSRLEDTSWIKPGLVVWDWWNNWYLDKVNFEAGCNQSTYKYYIDYAAKHGISYVIMDEGWSEATGTSPDVVKKLLKFQGDINIPELVQYGNDRGVKIIVWMAGPVLEANWGEAWKKVAEWGIGGLKVDFTDRDDQIMREFYYDIARKAAELKMVIDFHGGSKPTGLSRTYPNVLTEEAVKGLECVKFNEDCNPNHDMLIPFIRGVIGPMDYTPGAMLNVQKAKFKKNYEFPTSMGTRCRQLALYVAFFSPFQMMADSPSHYLANPKSMNFILNTPTVWDESKALAAEVGKHVAVARRKGKQWYLGAINNWEGQKLNLVLDFLEPGQSYSMNAMMDGPHSADFGNDLSETQQIVKAGQTIEVSMSPGGGFVATFTPAP